MRPRFPFAYQPPGEGPSLPAPVLARTLGKPAAEWTADDLVALVRDEGIRIVSLMHVGGDGWLKTLDFTPLSESHLRDVLEGGERADGSSIFPGFGIERGASDIALRPRIATAFLDPFAPQPALALLAGHYGRDGRPLPQSPDAILRAAYQRLAREAGVDLWALGEVEYFLGKRHEESDIYGADDRGYHAASPFVFGEALRREALATLAGMGVPIKYGHAEVGYIEPSDVDDTIWEQHEIELALMPLPEAADAVALAQWVLRNLAHESDMRCSFQPIMRKGHAGSGLHFHFSPRVGGAHSGGRGTDGELTPASRWLIAGLVQCGGALMAFGNRVEGSFVRLTQGKEAPTSVTWGEFDRQALVRLPVVPTAADGRPVSPPTIEFRLPDGSAHPQLLLAGVAQAMLFGRATPELDALLERTSARARREGRGAAEEIPKTMAQVGRSLAEHRAALETGGVFPAAMIDGFVAQLAKG